MSARIRISAQVDGNTVEVDMENSHTTLRTDGVRQLCELLQSAVGKLSRAYQIDCEIRATPSNNGSES